jgi:hypothetical protein
VPRVVKPQAEINDEPLASRPQAAAAAATGQIRERCGWVEAATRVCDARRRRGGTRHRQHHLCGALAGLGVTFITIFNNISVLFRVTYSQIYT